jgi:hypothetical protein
MSARTPERSYSGQKSVRFGCVRDAFTNAHCPVRQLQDFRHETFPETVSGRCRDSDHRRCFKRARLRSRWWRQYHELAGLSAPPSGIQATIVTAPRANVPSPQVAASALSCSAWRSESIGAVKRLEPSRESSQMPPDKEARWLVAGPFEDPSRSEGGRSRFSEVKSSNLNVHESSTQNRCKKNSA